MWAGFTLGRITYRNLLRKNTIPPLVGGEWTWTPDYSGVTYKRVGVTGRRICHEYVT